MNNLIKVSLLRKQLSNRTSGIEPLRSGIYCWWFKKEVAQPLLKKLPLTQEELAKIQERKIEGESYLGLYFGISRDMLARAKWHILQKHSNSAVKYGTLSTLRQTISALLGVDMSESEVFVNDFIDNKCKCYWEWEYDEGYKQRETGELSSTTKCYPLNIQENKTITKEVCKELIKLRKQYKK